MNVNVTWVGLKSKIYWEENGLALLNLRSLHIVAPNTEEQNTGDWGSPTTMNAKRKSGSDF